MDILIPNWRRAWRMASVQIAALAVVFGALPADTQAALLAAVGVPAARVPAIIGVWVLLGRLLRQPAAAEPAAPPPEPPPP
jgi:urea transporter